MQQQDAMIDPRRFRDVLGQYPTGVAAVTACGADGNPIGMVVGSFGSVSLDPPLVSFMPDKRSSTWAKLQDCDHYCVNILGVHQEDVCRDLASKGPDKFAGIKWEKSGLGAPEIKGSIARIDCVKESIVDAGDHHIVLCRVRDLDIGERGMPLLFYRGGYGTFSSQTVLSDEIEILDKIKIVDRVRGHLDALSEQFGTEVSAMALVKGELVVFRSYGILKSEGVPSNIGLRLPFAPPIGVLFAAWGTDKQREEWISHANDYVEIGSDWCKDAIERTRQRGHAISFGPEGAPNWGRKAFFTDGVHMRPEQLRGFMASIQAVNQGDVSDGEHYELEFIGAPVFDPKGCVAISIVLWGPDKPISGRMVSEISDRLVSVADAATARIGGKRPD